MIVEHMTKIGGKWFFPGEEIPEETSTVVKEESSENAGYTKTEINRMSTADLQKLAAEHGVAGAEEISGAELKKILIEKFGL